MLILIVSIEKLISSHDNNKHADRIEHLTCYKPKSRFLATNTLLIQMNKKWDLIETISYICIFRHNLPTGYFLHVLFCPLMIFFKVLLIFFFMNTTKVSNRWLSDRMLDSR